MGYIIYTSKGLRERYDDITRLRLANLAQLIFRMAVDTDGKPRRIIIKPGSCNSEFSDGGNVLSCCLSTITNEIIAEYERSREGAIHIYLRLAEEQPETAFSQ